MSKIKVAIIDSGVKSDHKAFLDDCIDCITVLEDGDIEDHLGHGTAIYNILRKNIPEIEIVNIKVFAEDYEANVDTLIYALEYIEQHITVDVVNMSLGVSVCDKLSELYNVCKKLTDKGVILVSAFCNTRCISYPASFDNVIGVVSGYYCNHISDFEYYDDNVVNVAAKGGKQRVVWSGPEYIVTEGNSFACAHVTNQIIQYLKEGKKTRDEILRCLKTDAQRRYVFDKNINPNKTFFNIEKAVIYPFNKEMHGLLRYPELLPFKLVDVYDSKYSSRVGASTNRLMNTTNSNEFIIKDIESIEWQSFDTLILGHMAELNRLISQNDLTIKIVEKALANGKNIYAYDDLSRIGYERDSHIYYPRVDKEDIPINRMGMLSRISKPVVGVFGTSSQQGKYTLQLEIRKRLLRLGYNVGQIATEPNAMLFGIDYCFPMGYNSSVYISETDTVRYLNYAVHDLCLKNKDIIIVGCQSGTVTYDVGNIAQYAIPQYSFMLGTLPDCIILCVNSYDEMEYVLRTKRFIEASINCEVIGIVVYPVDITGEKSILGSKKTLSYEKFERIKKNLWEVTGCPIFLLGDVESMEALVEQIIQYFEE